MGQALATKGAAAADRRPRHLTVRAADASDATDDTAMAEEIREAVLTLAGEVYNFRIRRVRRQTSKGKDVAPHGRHSHHLTRQVVPFQHAHEAVCAVAV